MTPERMNEHREIATLLAAVYSPTGITRTAAAGMVECLDEINRLQTQEREVYALFPGPVDQVTHIPLGQFVRTRFVTVEEFNERDRSQSQDCKPLDDAIRRDQMERDCMAVDGCRVAAPIESKMTLVDAVDAIRRAFEEQTK